MLIKHGLTILLLAIFVAGCKKEPKAEDARVAQIRAEKRPASEVVQVHIDHPQGAVDVTADKILSADPAFVALSADEVRWLTRNGFLEREQWAALQALGETELLRRSREQGDMTAATALGLARARSGDAAGAIRSLDRAARSGSLYALEQLAFAELQDFQTGTGPRDIASEELARAAFVARMEQARIMGDHRVDFYIDQVASGLDRQRYGDQILRQTTEYMRQMGEDASIRGVPARGPDARPNIDLWQRSALDPSSSVQAMIR